MGIGHFIWLPKGFKGGYEETFPELIVYLERWGYSIPHFIKANPFPPWKSREDFFSQIDTPEMKELRDFFRQTELAQGCFIIKRFEKILDRMLEVKRQERIIHNYNRLKQSPQGLFAMIDYTHFKGEGTEKSAKYQGIGWGLYDVLMEMEAEGEPVKAFVNAAKYVLRRRVAHSPKERNEAGWIPGWDVRLEGYLESVY